MDGRRVHDHATDRRRPLFVSHVVSVLAHAVARDDPTNPALDLVGLLRDDVALPEDGAARLGGEVLEGLLEGDVGRGRLEHSVLVDQAEEARGVVEDRVPEDTLLLARRCLPVRLGDVEAAGDDPCNASVRAVGAARFARATTSVSPRTLVNVFSYSAGG